MVVDWGPKLKLGCTGSSHHRRVEHVVLASLLLIYTHSAVRLVKYNAQEVMHSNGGYIGDVGM